MKIDEARDAILRCDTSWASVQAFAGAGKTRLAMELIRRFMDEPGLSGSQKVLAISFSNASCIRAREALEKASMPRNCVEVATFHSFSFGLVRRYARRLGMTGPIHTGRPGSSSGTYVSFDDLITGACKLLEHSDIAQIVKDTFPLVIVDEFQDTTEPLLRVLKRAFPLGDALVRCFGDEDQRIQPGANQFNPHQAAVHHGASDHAIVPIRGFCRYETHDVACLAASFRDSQPFSRLSDMIKFERVGGENEQLAHCIHWDALKAQQAGRSAAVLCFSNELVSRLHDLLSKTTEKRRVPLSVGVVTSSNMGACRDWLFVALLEHWLYPTNTTHTAVLNAMALLSVGGDDTHRYFSGRCARLNKEQKKGDLPQIPHRPEGAQSVPSLADVLQDLGAAASELGRFVAGLWSSAALNVSGLEGLARTLSWEAPPNTDLRTPNVFSRLGRAWDQTRRWRHSSQNSVLVMTVNQAKNREFDDVFVFVDGYKNEIRSPISGSNRMQMYVAASRARRYLKIIALSGKKVPRAPLLEAVFVDS